jgi:peptidoglycan LD-endopeptidase CwlK
MRRLVLSALVLCAPLALMAQPSTKLGKPCWPEDSLKGRDTAYAAFPCNDKRVYPIGVLKQVECVEKRLKDGGWTYKIYETYRSDRRQRWLYAQGRTRPGPRVTNVATAQTGNHYWGLGIDIIHGTRLWSHERFFYWLGQHYEACGMVAGAFWKRFPDAPHGQFAAWESASRRPDWARRYMAAGHRDSLWLRLGVTR